MTENLQEALPEAILFDWDNTLVDNWGVIHEAMNATLVKMGHEPWPLEESYHKIRRSAGDVFPELFGDRADEALRYYYEAFESFHLERLEAIENAERLLKAAFEKGIKLAVVSNKRGHYLRKEIDHMGWSRYFNAIVGAGDAAKDKPDAAPALMALNEMGIKPHPTKIWFVGDTDTDMETAQNAGLLGIYVETAKMAGIQFDLKNLPHIRYKNLGALLAKIS